MKAYTFYFEVRNVKPVTGMQRDTKRFGRGADTQLTACGTLLYAIGARDSIKVKVSVIDSALHNVMIGQSADGVRVRVSFTNMVHILHTLI